MKIIIIILLCLNILCIVQGFIPSGRFGQSSVLVGNRLYFLGGDNGSHSCSDDIFYLDLSSSFNVHSPPWYDMKYFAVAPVLSSWSAVGVSEDGLIIYLIGGYMSHENNLVHSFDTRTSKWSLPATQGETPSRKHDVQAATDHHGRIYVLGEGELNILDTNKLLWSLGSTYQIPSARKYYTSTFLPSGIIVYVGGNGYNECLNRITTYNTWYNIWSSMVVDGFTVEERESHSAALTDDGRIIIFGGFKQNTREPAYPGLVVIHTNFQPFGLSIPYVSRDSHPPPLAYHSAAIYRDSMIITFGKVNNQHDNNGVFILDIRNYEWVKFFHSEIYATATVTVTATVTATVIPPIPPFDRGVSRLNLQPFKKNRDSS